jgi:hypothetical protein
METAKLFGPVAQPTAERRSSTVATVRSSCDSACNDEPARTGFGFRGAARVVSLRPLAKSNRLSPCAGLHAAPEIRAFEDDGG